MNLTRRQAIGGLAALALSPLALTSCSDSSTTSVGGVPIRTFAAMEAGSNFNIRTDSDSIGIRLVSYIDQPIEKRKLIPTKMQVMYACPEGVNLFLNGTREYPYHVFAKDHKALAGSPDTNSRNKRMAEVQLNVWRGSKEELQREIAKLDGNTRILICSDDPKKLYDESKVEGCSVDFVFKGDKKRINEIYLIVLNELKNSDSKETKTVIQKMKLNDILIDPKTAEKDYTILYRCPSRVYY